MPITQRPSLLSLAKKDITALLKEANEPAYRAGQILDWIYKKRVLEIQEMSNLPADFREKLQEMFTFHTLTHTKTEGSSDTTRKYLFKLHDGRYVETVLIPASPALYGERSDRYTACVSSQVGCAFGCKFCASGLNGLTRNLSTDEIVGQLLAVERESGKRINNIVFMGMGEPMANLKNMMKALDIITAEWGINIGARHITISTSGVAPGIKELADRPQQIRLAISLHGATDEVRGKIMPVNKKWNIEALFESLHYWKSLKKQKITFEFILIKDVNDSFDQARALVKLAKSLQAKVNLIPYNKVEGLTWVRPTDGQCKAFRDILVKQGIVTTLRIEKGHDIDAACGQLRLKEETKEGIITSPIQTLR